MLQHFTQDEDVETFLGKSHFNLFDVAGDNLLESAPGLRRSLWVQFDSRAPSAFPLFERIRACLPRTAPNFQKPACWIRRQIVDEQLSGIRKIQFRLLDPRLILNIGLQFLNNLMFGEYAFVTK